LRWSESTCEGIAAEFAGIELGDQRLNQRSVQILEALAANPEASVNASMEKWGDTLAAYRFFRNPQVSPEKLLAAHGQATLCRMREHPVVLLVQDTTELDFTAHPPEGAQCLNAADRFGLYDHTQLAVTPQQLCLGMIGGEQFARAAETLGKKRQRKSLPIEAKESHRWLSGYRLACELRQQLGTTRIVSVADREADIYELLVEVQRQANPADFVIRAQETAAPPSVIPSSQGGCFIKCWTDWPRRRSASGERSLCRKRPGVPRGRPSWRSASPRSS
jgi:hypothetical protein